jgi:hypothetical protein
MALMRHEARGILSPTYARDLDVHDAGTLAAHGFRDCFAWILHPMATWIGVTSVSRRTTPIAETFVWAYGLGQCRFFFWTGAVFVRCPSASALYTMLATAEECLRERERAGALADGGIA